MSVGRLMLKKLLVLAALLAPLPALAQSVQQSGTVTRNHVAVWNTSGVIADGGTSASSPISSFGVTNNGSCGIGINSAAITSVGYQQLCLGVTTAGAATISLQNFGTAPTGSLQFVINGVSFPFPGSLANITIGTTPVVGGTTGQCLFVSGGFVGQQTCTLSAITSLIGDVTATGPGVSTATLTASGVTPGTYGSATLTPIITVDAKGRITGVTTTAPGITVGSTVITSGTTNGLLYANGSVLGNLATAFNGVLVTNGTGVPSISTTLPSGIAIPGPTFTGTVTFPDSATWTTGGISKAVALSVGSATLPSSGNVSISGQYQINGTQIAASNLSNGTTGSGAVVLAASPALSGTVTGSFGFSGNITYSGQLIAAGTSAPASAAGNTVVMGTIASPTLTNTGQAFLYNTTVNGAILEGDGSTNDVSLFNKSGALVAGIPTGTTKLNFPSLVSGTCSSGLGLDSGNNTILISCPGAAASIQVGTTTIVGGTNNNILTIGTGTLANVTIASLLTAGTGINITGTTNATISSGLVAGTGINITGATVSTTNTPVLLNTLTASNSATLFDTTTFSGSYSFYELVFENILPVTASQAIFLQVHSGGAFPGTNYVSMGTVSTAGGAFSGTSSTTNILISGSVQNNSGPGVNGSIRISTPLGTSAPKIWLGNFAGNTSAPASYYAVTSGYWNGGNGAVDGFQVFSGSGNIASGVIKIYGYP